jgi:dipeptidyl aminopeptidase/acylaminoacyl peptidase
MKKHYLILSILIFAFVIISCSQKEDKSMIEEKKDDVTEIKGKHNFTAVDLMSMDRVSDPQVSPDGQWVLFRVSKPSIADNKFYSDLYVVSIDGSEIKQLTDYNASVSNGRWSPDGTKIAFLSNKEKDGTQIFTMDFPKTKSRQITYIDGGVSNLSWSPDGKYFSFTSDVKMKDTPKDMYPDYPEANVRIYESVPVRHWDHWIDENFSHLFIIPSDGGEPKDLTKDEPYDVPQAPFGGVEQISWSPDSKEICYASKKSWGKEFVEGTNTDLYVVNIETGETQNITEGMMGFDLEPLYSPDGKWLLFNSMERPGFESDRHRLMLFDRNSKEISELTKMLDQWAGGPAWSPDSKTVYFNATDSGCYHLFSIDIASLELKKLTDEWTNDNSGLGVTSDGKYLVFGREDMQHPTDIWRINTDGTEPLQLTEMNKERLEHLNNIKIEERWITSTDGAKVMCWVLYPPNFDESKKYPMITYLQGGPQSMIGQRFHFRWNYYLMASHDYIVLLPNRRGLPGFGQDWNDAISGDWGGKPMQDILAATDELAKEPYVDNDGLCAVGASAGGYAAFWLAGNHQGRFKAFIAHCGVFNMESMYGSTEELWFPNWENGGPYWDSKNKAFYEKHSAHKYAQNWDTPILISTGEYDFRVPYTQSLEAFTVAQVKGIPSKLLVFPDETHFIAKPQEFIIWSSEFFGFLDKYTKK